MYSIDWAGLFTRPHQTCPGCERCRPSKGFASTPHARTGWTWSVKVSGTVWALGFTSLLTDVSSEMVASVLPVYLVFQVGLSPLAFGVVDGLYQGIAALVRVAAGLFADRWQRYKDVATAGYGLSALCRLGILAAGTSASTIAGVVALDRIGKGIRTAPRDALIALRSPCHDLATSFGVHRALDAAGAMLGPIVAFLLLARLPGAFDVLFVVSFAIAVVGVAVIALFVRAPHPLQIAPGSEMSTRGVLATAMTPRLRTILIAGFLLGVPTISDSFIFLSLQRRLDIVPTAFPLLFVGTSIATSLLAVPFGRAADRFGRTIVFLAGYALLIAVYLTLLAPVASPAFVVIPLALLGAYYAATDGVLNALAASLLPASASASGLSLLATVINIARLIASLLFGFLWMTWDIDAAVVFFLVTLVIAACVSVSLLIRAEWRSRQGNVPTLGAN